MDATLQDIILKAVAQCPAGKEDRQGRVGKVQLMLLREGQLVFCYRKPNAPELSYRGKWALVATEPFMCYKVKVFFKSHTVDGRPSSRMGSDTVSEPESGSESGSFILCIQDYDIHIKGALPSGIRYLLRGTPLRLEEHNARLGAAEGKAQSDKQAHRRAKMCAIFAWADEDGDGFLSKQEASRWRHETGGGSMDKAQWAYFCEALGVATQPGIPRHKFLGPLGPYQQYAAELEDHFGRLCTKYPTVFKSLRTIRHAQEEIGVGLFGTAAKGRELEEEEKAERVAEAFRQWDLDGNGRISRQELSQVLEQLVPHAASSPKATKAMFDSVDGNKDDELDYEEFVNWLFQGGRAGAAPQLVHAENERSILS